MKIKQVEARKRCDADYVRGFIMYLATEACTSDEEVVLTTQKEKWLRILDSKNGDTYFATGKARELEILSDFPWGATSKQVNEMATRSEAWMDA